jgi:hypothetical protein
VGRSLGSDADVEFMKENMTMHQQQLIAAGFRQFADHIKAKLKVAGLMCRCPGNQIMSIPFAWWHSQAKRLHGPGFLLALLGWVGSWGFCPSFEQRLLTPCLPCVVGADGCKRREG